MSGNNRRGEKISPPPDGWPQWPKGDQSKLDAITAWLMPDIDNRVYSTVIWSRADAAAHIRKIAVGLLADLQSSTMSPTLRDAREKLDKIHSAAIELDRMLRTMMGPHLTGIVAMECGFFRRSLTDNGPEYDLAAKNDILARPLRLLAKTTRQYRAELNDVPHGGGGRQRLHERLVGDPRLRFGWSCALLLRECRGGEAAPIPKNDQVLELMQMVWAYAIGDDPPPEFLEHEAKIGAQIARRGGNPRQANIRMMSLIRPKIAD